ncbi:MAG TPA: glycosyltransferase family 4 protein [Stellaceae bacterium]|nr:glycosyltransferase family 4 protein [Stellaceae bacterium]
MRLALLVPGSLDQLTGGYLFARRIVDGLRARGDVVAVTELDGCFPDADGEARDAAAAALGGTGGGEAVVIDGLALAGFEACLAAEAARLRLIAWVHHPLADETGLDERARARFRGIEASLLPRCRGVICPSDATAQAVAAYGVAPARLAVAPPGTAKPARARSAAAPGDALRLLTVATATPRKGHLVLIEALARLPRKDWRLRCIGSLQRDPAYVASLRQAIAAQGLAERVTLQDEIPPEALDEAYAAADLFVLPSFHEGYGMALAEAMAHGLPILATSAGAIPTTVPEAAGILVAPGDADALAEALSRLIEEPALRARLAAGAAAAGRALPDWDEAVTRWRNGVARLLR